MEEERQEGIFSPPAIAGWSFIHFAIDNPDWHEKTLDGSTFHPMTTNVYCYEECIKQEWRDHSLCTGIFGDIPRLSTSKKTKRSLCGITPSAIEPHYIWVPVYRLAKLR